jgi:hypothetical protein
MARKALQEAEIQALSGAIGDSGYPGMEKVGERSWVRCRERIEAARRVLDAVLETMDEQTGEGRP